MVVIKYYHAFLKKGQIMTIRKKSDVSIIDISFRDTDTFKQVSVYRNKKVFCLFNISKKDFIDYVKVNNFDIINLY